MTSDDPTTHPRVRVALVGCTGLLGDIIGRTVAAQPEVDVIGDFPSGELPAPDAADLVVWNDADEREVASWLLALRREPRVLATAGDGRDAALWQLAPHRALLGALSPTTLAEALADVAGGVRP